MIVTLSRMLVNAAARRWPTDSQVRREWLAELDYLAAHRGRGRVLGFAVGLAFARPADAPAVGLTWRTAGTTLFLLAGPTALLVLSVLSMYALAAINADSDSLAIFWGWLAGLLIVTAVAGRWWGARSVITGPAGLALTLGLSITVTLLLAPVVYGHDLFFEELLTGIVVWAPALFVLLFSVSRAAQAHRGGRVAAAGLLAWLVILDVAVMVEFLPSVGPHPQAAAPPGAEIIASHAPMWFVYSLTNDSFGVLNWYEMLVIGDDTVFMPHMLIMFAVYGMSHSLAATRRPAGQPAALSRG